MNEKINYIALAIPFFMLLMIVEIVASFRRRQKQYRLADAMADISCGVANQVTGAFWGAALLAIYAYVYEHWRIVSLTPNGVVEISLAILGVDFLYYWWHRLSHEVNLMWAGHVVHHQSEDYNLAVALRQSVLTSFTSVPFYLPLALLGVSPMWYMLSIAISLIYQYWIHTELIRSLGPLEHILNTPAHHRVHHAINPRYLDKNYAAILIIWDKLFGTFEPETETPVYGLVQPLRSMNPIWAQFAYLVDLVKATAKTPRLQDKVLVWLKGPAWSVPGLPSKGEPPEVSRESFVKYDPSCHPIVSGYAATQFFLVVSATFFYLLFAKQLESSLFFSLGLLLLFATLSLSGLVEKKSWALAAEWLRLTLTVSAVGLLFWKQYLTGAVLVVSSMLVVASLLFCFWMSSFAKNNSSRLQRI